MFSVGTNFDDRLIEKIKDFNVYEVYGKLSRDIVGGGRSSFLLGEVTKKLELDIPAESLIKLHTKKYYSLNIKSKNFVEEALKLDKIGNLMRNLVLEKASIADINRIIEEIQSS